MKKKKINWTRTLKVISRLEYLVEGKDVFVIPIVRQVGIFYASVGNSLLGAFQLFWCQNFISLFFQQLFFGPFKTLVEQVH